MERIKMQDVEQALMLIQPLIVEIETEQHIYKV
jgi:hypothetical protein